MRCALLASQKEYICPLCYQITRRQKYSTQDTGRLGELELLYRGILEQHARGSRGGSGAVNDDGQEGEGGEGVTRGWEATGALGGSLRR